MIKLLFKDFAGNPLSLTIPSNAFDFTNPEKKEMVEYMLATIHRIQTVEAQHAILLPSGDDWGITIKEKTNG